MGVLTSATEPTLEGRGVLAVIRQIRSLISLCVLVKSMHSYCSQPVIHWERRAGPGNTRSPPRGARSPAGCVGTDTSGALASSLPQWVWCVPPPIPGKPMHVALTLTFQKGKWTPGHCL